MIEEKKVKSKEERLTLSKKLIRNLRTKAKFLEKDLARLEKTLEEE